MRYEVRMGVATVPVVHELGDDDHGTWEMEDVEIDFPEFDGTTEMELERWELNLENEARQLILSTAPRDQIIAGIWLDQILEIDDDSD